MYTPHTPHSFAPKTFINRLPRIFLTDKAYRDQNIIVKLADEEIGWLGIVSEIGEDFLIEEVFIVDQEVSGAHCELDEDGLAQLGEDLIGRENGLELANSLRFWGHSHVRMEVSPSNQDDNQVEDFRTMGNPYMIRGILNKKGKARYDIFYFNRGYHIEDVPWSLYCPYSNDDVENWKQQIESKVTVLKPVRANAYGRYGGVYINHGTAGRLPGANPSVHRPTTYGPSTAYVGPSPLWPEDDDDDDDTQEIRTLRPLDTDDDDDGIIIVDEHTRLADMFEYDRQCAYCDGTGSMEELTKAGATITIVCTLCEGTGLSA